MRYPVKYVKGLSEKDKLTHKKEMDRRKKAWKERKFDAFREHKPRKLESYRHKKSPWVQQFHRLYPRTPLTKASAIRDEFGVRVSEQATILKKGMGAYMSSGSRPGQTGRSWALARLASVLLGGPACTYDLPKAKCAALARRRIR